MGSVTAGTLAARVRQLTEHDLPELLSDADVLALLNEVYAEMWGLFVWPSTISSVDLSVSAGASSVSGVPDNRGVYQVLVKPVGGGDWLPARQRSVGPVDWTDRTGFPTEFIAQSDGSLLLWPTVDADVVVRVYYIVPPVPFADLSSVFAFHDEFAPAVAYGAAARLLAQEDDDSGRIAAYQREYEALLQRMRLVYLNEVVRPFSLGGSSARWLDRRGRRRRRSV